MPTLMNEDIVRKNDPKPLKLNKNGILDGSFECF
jgi:hypothetical protein